MREEDKNQIWLVEWAWTQKDIGPYLIHIRNEGIRTFWEGKKAKLMGLRPGASDLFFAFPVKKYGGLWIEMKSEKGYVGKSQRAFLDLMKKVGYKIAVCRSWTQAANTILEYVGREDRV